MQCTPCQRNEEAGPEAGPHRFRVPVIHIRVRVKKVKHFFAKVYFFHFVNNNIRKHGTDCNNVVFYSFNKILAEKGASLLYTINDN
jgi:hypothetical protein